MGFGGSGGSGGTIGSATDAALSNPLTGHTLTYNGSIAKWQNTQAVQVPIRFSAAQPVVGVTGSDKAYSARTIIGANMRTQTAPVGSDLSIVLQQSSNNGASWTALGTLTIAANSTAETSLVLSQSQIVGWLLRLSVISVGSTTPATHVVVDVLWQ